MKCAICDELLDDTTAGMYNDLCDTCIEVIRAAILESKGNREDKRSTTTNPEAVLSE